MTRKKPSLFAFLFLPVMAFIFAGFFTIIGVMGWRLFHPDSSEGETARLAAVQTASAKPEKQPQHKTSGQTQQTQPAQQPVSSQETLNLPTQPRERFLLGLKQCKSRPAEKFPCAWQDTQFGVIKQFKMDKPGEPIVRRVYDMGGKLLNITSFNTQQGYVILYRDDKNVNWFFDRFEVLRQVARPSKTAKNLQDAYFYTVSGKLNSCVCADKTQACCTDAPRISSPGNRYCELFPLDQEFCSK